MFDQAQYDAQRAEYIRRINACDGKMLSLKDMGLKWGIWDYGAWSEIERLKKLESLDLSGNDIDTIPFSCSNFPKLKHLDLAGNDLQYWATSKQFKLNRLKFPALETLDLAGNLMGWVIIPYQTEWRKSIVSLNLSGNHFPHWYDSIHRRIKVRLGIAVLPKLTQLSLARCELTHVPKLLFAPNLESLDLSGNPLHCNHQHLLKLKRLRRLDLRATQLKRVPKALFQMPYLEQLNLTDNEIPQHDLIHLSRVLTQTELKLL